MGSDSTSASPGPVEPSADERLDSWKEIAAYLKRDVRTLYRWEKEEGLPVRRHLHGKRGSVYAYKAELDAWWNNRRSLLEQQPRRRSHFWLAGAAGALALVLLGLVSHSRWRNSPKSAALLSPPAFRGIALDGTQGDGFLLVGDAGDLNGDGRTDLVLSAVATAESYVFFGGELPATGGKLPRAADVVISGASRAGFRVSQIGDFNGDSFDDLLLSQDLPEPESFSTHGASFILWGRRRWPKSMTIPESADVTLRLEAKADPRLKGCGLPGIRADLNRDGLDDILLGAIEYGSTERRASGSLFVFFGRRQWLGDFEVSSVADVTIRGAETGEGLGATCALGDFNEDGRTDLAVYATQSTLWYLLGGRGAVYLFLGKKTWPSRLDAKTDFDLRIEGPHPKAYSWSSLQLADLNGDRSDDLVIAWPRNSGRPELPGELQVWLGGRERRGLFSASAADVAIAGSAPGAQLGHGLTATDLDSDGFVDLVLSEPGPGTVYLLYGRRQWKPRGRLKDYQPVTLFQAGEGAGSWRIARADLDADYLPELVFTSAEAQVALADRTGRAWVLKPYVPIRVDVRPEMEPNVLLHGAGISAVRVYGFSPASPEQVDPSSLRLASAAPFRHVWEDYNGDGIPDLQAYFDNNTLKLESEARLVALTGRTRAGLPVAGTDSVALFRPGSPSRQAGTADQVQGRR